MLKEGAREGSGSQGEPSKDERFLLDILTWTRQVALGNMNRLPISPTRGSFTRCVNLVADL